MTPSLACVQVLAQPGSGIAPALFGHLELHRSRLGYSLRRIEHLNAQQIAVGVVIENERRFPTIDGVPIALQRGR